MLYSTSDNISTATPSNANKFIQVPVNNSNRRRSDNTTGRSGNSAKHSDESPSPLLSSNRKGSVSWQNLDKECASKSFENNSSVKQENTLDSSRNLNKNLSKTIVDCAENNTTKSASHDFVSNANLNNNINMQSKSSVPPIFVHNPVTYSLSSPASSSSTTSSTTSSTSSFASTSPTQLQTTTPPTTTNTSIKLTSTLPINSSNEPTPSLNANLAEQQCLVNDSIELNGESDSISNKKKSHSQTNLNSNNQLTAVNLSSSLLLNNNNSNNSANPSSLLPPSSPDSFRKSSFGGSIRRDSTYKKQKENYLTEKKRITNDMLTIMRDETIIVLADWLKIRGSLKNWIKLYVILKPGIMLLFKSDKMKPGQWVGTIILNSCQLLERPSKKHGFCFKIFHPLERSIWASKGPAGETYINVPYMLLPTFYLIFRAPSENIGNIWMEAIELTLKSGHLLKPSASTVTNQNMPLNIYPSNSNANSNLTETFRTNNSTFNLSVTTATTGDVASSKYSPHRNTKNNQASNSSLSNNNTNSNTKEGSESLHREDSPDLDSKHFKDIVDTIEDEQAAVVLSDSDNGKNNSSDEICSLNSSNENLDDEYYGDNGASIVDQIFHHKERSDTNLNDDECDEYVQEVSVMQETKYVQSPQEEFGELGNKEQTEEVGEENKSLIFCLVKQVRPGMDLSKVVLPTFILEPRSFLEKLTDFYYHSDILSESINNDDPYERIKTVVKFYLSGFYKKPKGLKKPYNPILGEVFRSYWYNPKTDSKTFYVAEQVSHHPPITSFYVINRKEGFCIYGTIYTRSKFYGNSVSAIMDGSVKLILLNRGEEYVVTLPYANCKGILIGKLTMELGGKVSIECAKTGYSAEIEFKLKPLLGGIEASNIIDGKIKLAKETISLIRGKWDGEIILQEKTLVDQQPKSITLWNPTKQTIESRLKRYIVSYEDQMEFESEKLWSKVSEAIKNCDQNLATEEKSKIESRQREKELERKQKFIEYKSKFFTYDSLNKEWLYNYFDLRPWDTLTDLFQYEYDFKINTSTKHKLTKINSRSLNDQHASILSLQHHHHHHHHHQINQQHHHNHHDQTPRLRQKQHNNVLTNEETPDYFLIHFNEIKERLDRIETKLNHLTKKTQEEIDPSKTSIVKENITPKLLKHYAPKNSTFNVLKSPAIIIFLLAWIFGLATAIYSKRIFSRIF